MLLYKKRIRLGCLSSSLTKIILQSKFVTVCIEDAVYIVTRQLTKVETHTCWHISKQASLSMYILRVQKSLLTRFTLNHLEQSCFFNEFNGHRSILAGKNTVLDSRNIPPHPHVWTELVNLKLGEFY